MRILIIGSGGREHALAWKIAQSPRVKKIFAAPGNPGTAQFAQNVPMAADDVKSLIEFARREKIDLTVVGPERPLIAGIVDAFQEAGLRIFGPNAAAARLEGSKSFCKQLLRHHAVPTAEYRSFKRAVDARKFIETRDEAVVVKASGEALGKGVFVCETHEQAFDAVQQIMVDRVFGDAGNEVVIEEKLTGEEASILALVDGRNIYTMESSQDHKAIFDGDKGPNTGGMGAYSPAPVVTDAVMSQIERDILVPTVHAMNHEGCPYSGLLYAGVMLTPGGPKVLEFNVRFGDPEAQPLMMRLKSDIIDAMEATIDGRLDEVTLEWSEQAAVGVVMAAAGYPGDYQKGKVITGLDDAATMNNVMVFQAGTREVDGRIVTAGGRVLCVTAVGPTIADAKILAYEAAQRIRFEGAQYRTDIADKALRRR
ncbi:MAG TPA: phosphoribosylamine--glycine ligase [Phycisphaerae bacterium]|nr:phosphoribosylamine--glycine ligase [Phycisphaerae bacterium]HOI54710.1 phosphoribosylamine--glycine ligase [Phycisphaerae bacterium]